MSRCRGGADAAAPAHSSTVSRSSTAFAQSCHQPFVSRGALAAPAAQLCRRAAWTPAQHSCSRRLGRPGLSNPSDTKHDVPLRAARTASPRPHVICTRSPRTLRPARFHRCRRALRQARRSRLRAEPETSAAERPTAASRRRCTSRRRARAACACAGELRTHACRRSP